MVVRKANFSAAADELGVSQSAVSQHVKMLENWLGEDLLERGARQSRPTPEGQVLAKAVADGLGQIQDACTDIRRKKRENTGLVVSCPAGFAFTWLFPRLLEFDLAHPEISISITTDSSGDDSLSEGADVGVHYGLGGFPGLYVEHLMSEVVFPVCAPALFPDADSGKADLGDLSRVTLLVDDLGNKGGTPPNWEFWARECGLTLPRMPRTRQFSQSNMVTQAAIQGLGVAMGREPLVIDAIAAGQLVRPFPQVALSQYSYWLVCRHTGQKRQNVQDFMAWIRNSATQQLLLSEQSGLRGRAKQSELPKPGTTDTERNRT